MSITGSRDNYDSLVPWARCLLSGGRSIGDVMCAIYGVDLPSEAYVLGRALDRGLNLDLSQLFYPWELIALAASGNVRDSDPWSREQEERAFAAHPSFLPLLQLGESEALHGEHLIGYDLDELRNGKTIVLGHRGDLPDSDFELKVLGTSLLAVIHEWIAWCLRMVKHQYAHPTNFGAGAVDDSDVERVADQVRAVEALQKTVALIDLAEP